MNYSLVGFFLVPSTTTCFTFLNTRMRVDIYFCCCCFPYRLLHGVSFPGSYRGSWSFIYFINSCVHILLWSSSFLHTTHLYILVTESLFSKSVRLSLQARSSFLSIFRLHLEWYHMILESPCLPYFTQNDHLLSFLWPDLAFFPTGLWLRNIAWCVCPLSSIYIHLRFYN